MTFADPILLWVLALPAVWLVLAWRPGGRRIAQSLEAATVAAIVLAFAQPTLNYRDRKMAVAVLADTSASIPPDDLRRASKTVEAIEASRGNNTVSVLPFARKTRPLSATESRTGELASTSGDDSRGTNLETSIREAIASLPAGAVGRIALITDGNENAGSVTRAVWQAQQLGIAIDTFPLPGRNKPELRVESVSAPANVFSGERFPVDLTVSAPRHAPAHVEIEAEHRKLGDQPVTLEAGENHIRLRASVNTNGATQLSGRVVGDAKLGETRFEYALTVRKPRVLLVSHDPAEANQHLEQLLTADQFAIDRSTGALPQDLAAYQLIVFNNANVEDVSIPDQTRLETFEQQGGGLLWIAGEKNVYVDRKKAPEPPLARALPAKIAPPRSPQGKCVVLIIDKSSSMEGKKIELARLAAIGVVENLKPDDWVAVLIFDNSFQWAVPLRRAGDRAQISRLISGITPDGGTQIAPALAEAYGKVLPVDAVYKHIVLLTDGISEEGDSAAMAHEAAANHVTISTVGLGQDVNRAYLEKIAANAKGKSYFLLEPAGLEQILLKDVQEHTGTTTVEKPLQAEATAQKATLLEGVDLKSAPPLAGYVRFEARPDAEQVLTIDRDPLLVRWQNGLGRAAVFTSDAKNRWAADWLKWKDFDRFWTNVVRDLLPQAPETEAVADYDPATGALVVNYSLGRAEDKDTKAVAPELFALGPDGFRQPMQVAKIANGRYRARVSIGERQGLFRVRPLVESRQFPEVGLYRSEAEMTDFGSNERLLRQISSATGGRFRPAPGQVFDNAGRSTAASLALWPGLLLAAVILNLCSLLTRKWKGVRTWFPARVIPAS
jgi:secreted protein with Ig-like and vWFA domain